MNSKQKLIKQVENIDSNVLVLFAILISTFFLMAFLSGGNILQVSTLQSMGFQLPFLGLLALAQMGPMLTGGIDLSIISISNLSGIVAAIIMVELSSGPVIAIAIAAALLTALAAGTINGTAIAYLGTSPIITTLGSMIFLEGITLVITEGDIISGFPKAFQAIGNGAVFWIPIPLLIFLFVALIFGIVIERTPFGISTYMIGSNETATRYSGIDTRNMLFRTYLTTGFLAGISSLIMISRFNTAQSGTGFSYLLLTVLICVLGGISPNGGIGKVTGLVLAVLVLQVISSGFNLIGLSSYLAQAVWGITLILAIFLNKSLSGRAYG
ncbi:MAG: ABC transporter permease [Candidatus Acetothermia bacterium]